MASEIDIARPVVAWLRDQRWEVYQEVKLGDRRADIVAVQSYRLWVVETKTVLSLSLIEQVIYWRNYAHYVSAAVPSPSSLSRQSRGRRIAEMILARFDCGLIYVGPEVSYQRDRLTERICPTLRRQVLADRLRAVLCERQKTFAEAGNAQGDFWSPFKQTCRAVAEIVARHPGIRANELVEKVDHHYASPASARSSLIHWAEQGEIAGVELRREGRALRFYPVVEKSRGEVRFQDVSSPSKMTTGCLP